MVERLLTLRANLSGRYRFMSCTFCSIIARSTPAAIVYEDENTLAFLDHRPLFPGHVLVVPREHVATIEETSLRVLQAMTQTAQLLSMAVEAAVCAQGTFLALNNKVSQSVPHVHLHVVPRSKGDGLKGFFWPRNPYRDEHHRESVRLAIVEMIRLRNGDSPCAIDY